MKVIKQTQGSIPEYYLIGNIDEHSDFSLLSISKEELHVDCYEVARINSVGVKKWVAFFTELKSNGVQVYYYRVSTALSEQFNTIRNFGAGGEVVTVCVPLMCRACGKSNLVEKSRTEVISANLESIQWPCSACGETALYFDDDPQEFIRFLL